MTRTYPSQAQLLQLLDYDPETGRMTWRPRSPDMFSAGAQSAEHACKRWNARFAGKQAFAELAVCGYLRGCIDGRRYRSHVIAWIISTGRHPEGDVDHINGDPLDNRIANLRDVPHAINLRNAKQWSHNRSGHNGVYWSTRYGKWEAEAKVNKRKRYLGRFDRIEDAIAARKSFDAEHGFTARHGK